MNTAPVAVEGGRTFLGAGDGVVVDVTFAVVDFDVLLISTMIKPPCIGEIELPAKSDEKRGWNI